MSDNEAEYIGDSVYAKMDVDNWHLKLFTHNGIKEDNIIFLDDHTERALYRYLKKRAEAEQ